MGPPVRWHVPGPVLLGKACAVTSVLRDNLVKEARRVEEDVLNSSKGHYAAAERWRNVHLRAGVPTAVLTAIAGLMIVGGPAALGGISLNAIFGLVAIAGAISTAVMTFLGPDKRSMDHQSAADRYNSLRGRARRLREIDAHSSFTDEDLSSRLEALVQDRDELNKTSPLIPNSAYEKAKRSIEAGEATYGETESS